MRSMFSTARLTGLTAAMCLALALFAGQGAYVGFLQQAMPSRAKFLEQASLQQGLDLVLFRFFSKLILRLRFACRISLSGGRGLARPTLLCWIHIDWHTTSQMTF